MSDLEAYQAKSARRGGDENQELCSEEGGWLTVQSSRSVRFLFSSLN